MDLRQLLYFTTLAETLNFHRAAERLNISQPPLTVAIRKLEEELGAPLFVRGARGVTLTPAGRWPTPSRCGRRCVTAEWASAEGCESALWARRSTPCCRG